MSSFLLRFAASDEWRRLAPDGVFASVEPDAAKGEDEIPVLVVPAAMGVPFRLSLPFDDPEKIRLVLPQLLADSFARVGPGWRLSWEPFTDGASTVAHGLAFAPELFDTWLEGRRDWRLIVPDVFLYSGTRWAGRAIRFKTVVSGGLARFSSDGRCERLLLDGRGLPLQASLFADEEPVDVGFFDEPVSLCERLQSLSLDPRSLDLSGWRERRRVNLGRLAGISLVAAAATVFLMLHVFWYFDCIRLERFRVETTRLINGRFEATFPGQKAVEPVLQARRLLEELERQAGAVPPSPEVPMIPWLQAVVNGLTGRATIEKVRAAPEGWLIQGIIESYAALEKLQSELVSGDASGSRVLSGNGLRRGKVIRSTPVTGSGKTAGKLQFTLEGPWK
ncbi:MAG: hypothetical protein WA705_28135 [Candidatus Ozemobacteraceae bacterium]